MRSVSDPLEHTASPAGVLRLPLYRKLVLLLAVVFAARATVFALFVVPLWDVPDETGHFAYVVEVADGRIPLYGEALIPPDVVASWKGSATRPEPNWISQHPPLYYALAVPFLKAAEALDVGAERRFRSTRLLSVVFGSLTIPLLFAAVLEATRKPELAVSAAASLSVLPMFVHLSSGTNHDVAVAFAGTLAALFFFRALRTSRWRDAFAASGALAIAGAMKLTALAMAGPVIALVSWSLWRNGRTSPLRHAAIVTLAFSAPLAWIVRNKLASGSTLLLVQPERQKHDVAGFLSELPVIEHTIKNFIGLIGWTGVGQGELEWIQIGHAAYVPYFALLAAVVLAATAWYVETTKRELGRRTWLFLMSAWIVSFVALAAVNHRAPGVGGSLESSIYAAAVSILVFSAVAPWGERLSGSLRAASWSMSILLVFTAAFVIRIWNAYSHFGEMRATHGRYFFVVIAFAVVAIAYPAYLFVERRERRLAVIAALTLPFGLAAADVHFLIRDVLPFFRGAS